MSTSGVSEMNRVPNEDSEEPLLRYNSEFRDIQTQEEKKRTVSNGCLKCCAVLLTILLIVCGAIAIGLGVSLKYVNAEAQSLVASVSYNVMHLSMTLPTTPPPC